MITILNMVVAKYIHKPLTTLLSITLFTIGVTVISLVFKSEWFIQNNYKQNLAGIDLVVGAKGSPLQLILSSVLHVDAPTGNISLEEVEKVKRSPLVKNTIPISLGDNINGFRIVGTTSDYVNLYHAQLLEGALFDHPMEAVLGANVAKETGLQLHAQFAGVHGFMHEGHTHEDNKYEVCGILQPTGTVMDNLVLTPLESVWMVHNHAHHHDEDEGDQEHDHDHKGEFHHDDDHINAHEEHANHYEHEHEEHIHEIEEKVEQQQELTEEEMQEYNAHHGILSDSEHHPEQEITALLVFYKTPLAAARLPRMINENTSMQAASPVMEFNRLISLLGYGISLLKILAWMIILLSGINIFIYLLNSIRQGIGEIALLRATGVARKKIVLLIFTQGVLLSILGWVGGIVLSSAIWFVLPWSHPSDFIQTQVLFNDGYLLLYCILIALVAGLLPALKIYHSKIHYLLSR